MKGIGISPLDKAFSVPIVGDKQIISAASEERFSRLKQKEGFPKRTLQAALYSSEPKLSDSDSITSPFVAAKSEVYVIEKNHVDDVDLIKSFKKAALPDQIKIALDKVSGREDSIHGLRHRNEIMDRGILFNSFYNLTGSQKLLLNTQLFRFSKVWAESTLESFELWEKVQTYGVAAFGWTNLLKHQDHPYLYAANEYYACGHSKVLCIAPDFYASGLPDMHSIEDEIKIKRLHSISYQNSLCMLFENVTSSFGFKSGRYEELALNCLAGSIRSHLNHNLDYLLLKPFLVKHDKSAH